MIKKDSFYHFIVKEINKSSINRISLPTFTRVLRGKAHNVSSAQLLFVYKELQRIKSKASQFHLSSQKITQYNRPFNPKAGMKMQSYQKHTLICLQQIAIKLKQKNGYQQGFDLCKLLYYRLINAIEYNLPHAHIAEMFSEQFLWRDFGEDIIDYVGLIEKDPSGLGKLFVDTVNHIIQSVHEQLQVIDILQLPYLKSVLSKGQLYPQYYIIDQSLMKSLDELIQKNKFVYSFKELQVSLMADQKHDGIHTLYSLMSKDLAEKRLSYMFIDGKNYMLSQSEIQDSDEIRGQLGLPGKSLEEEYFDFALKKITQLNMFSVYIDLFSSIHQKQKQINKAQLARNYIKYHFKYFMKSGNVNCKLKDIKQILSNTFESRQKMVSKGLRFQHMEILKLFIVSQFLSKNDINGDQMIDRHYCLQKDLYKLNTIHKLKLDEISKIFESSLLHFGSMNESESNIVQKTLFQFIKNIDIKILSDLISEELSYLSTFQKNFVMNELILSLLRSLLDKNITKYTQVIAKLLDTFMKLQFKKFSTQFSNVQKLIDLIPQKNTILKRQQQQNKTVVVNKQIPNDKQPQKILSC